MKSGLKERELTDEPRLALWLLSNVATAAFGYFSRDLFRVLRESIQALWSEYKTRRRHQEQMQETREAHQHEIEIRSLDLDSEKIRMGMVSGYASDLAHLRDARSETDSELE